MTRLIVVSNRTPGKKPAAGGLAVALKKTFEQHDGFWFGWSGEFNQHPSREARFEEIEGITVGKIDLTRDDHQGYYAGFSNSVLWPAFHLRLDLTDIHAPWYESYRGVNGQFADALKPHLRPDDLVWVHDYQLIPLAHELRARGVRNRIGFYLHIPFPTPDALFAIPHHMELMRDLSTYDVLGFQAERDVFAFQEFMDHLPATGLSGVPVPHMDIATSHVGVFPIGSDPEAFASLSQSKPARKMISDMRRVMADRDLIIGVDRLDYSKGLPQRVGAYEKLLENNPALQRQVTMLQIAPPSRDGIREYQDIIEELDSAVGRVIGKFAEPDWQPLTYVKRAYGQAELAGLFRLARVGLVTPLRDGMNLVAHEYIGSQDPEDPGVLVLSRFAGAAEIFPDALQVNPFDTDETAEAMRIALAMPLDERIARWRLLWDAAMDYSVGSWAESFVDALAGTGKSSEDSGGATAEARPFPRGTVPAAPNNGTRPQSGIGQQVAIEPGIAPSHNLRHLLAGTERRLWPWP
jgi:trehalose 6-phosphate synthase